MATYLFVQGLDPVRLADEESFNKARARGNQVLTNTDSQRARRTIPTSPLHKLSFDTADGGRICINPEKFIGVGSDEAKD
jgi:hypothetical protein